MKKTLILAVMAVVFGTSPALAEGGEGDGMKRGPKGAMFKAADTNQDGTISKEEFGAFHGKVFDKMDIDGDGRITREEQQKRRAEWKEKRKGRMGERQERRQGFRQESRDPRREQNHERTPDRNSEPRRGHGFAE